MSTGAIDLPAPPVGPEVDLRDMDGFMMNVERLMASELWALSSGDEFKAAFALWCRAWKQMPAGSLPDDERTLAAFSGAGARWKKVREMALRGFVRCADGRLYHPVLCEDAKRAWKAKQQRRDAIAKRWSKAKDDSFEGASVQRPKDTQKQSRTYGTDTAVLRENYQGQGQGQGESSSLPPSADLSPWDGIEDEIWSMANLRPDAHRAAGKVDDFRLVRSWRDAGHTPQEVREACRAIIARAGEIRSLWKLLAAAIPEEVAKIRAERDAPPPASPEEQALSQWRSRVRGWAEKRLWLASWGPKPGEPYCEAPRQILAEFGLLEAA